MLNIIKDETKTRLLRYKAKETNNTKDRTKESWQDTKDKTKE